MEASAQGAIGARRGRTKLSVEVASRLKTQEKAVDGGKSNRGLYKSKPMKV